MVVNQRIYHVIPFVKVTFLLRHRIITRFLAAQSNRACVNYHDDRSKGGGDRTTWFHDKFFPSFRAIGEMITRRNGCESKSRKTFRPRPILSLSLHLENTLPPVSYLSFVTISLSNRIYTSSSTLNYSVEGNSMSKARQLPRRILSRLETTKLIARPSTRSSVSTVLFSDSFGIFLLLGPRWHGARVL